MSPADLRARLNDLKYERVAAAQAGLTSCQHYMADLEAEEAECVEALTTALVTEIAVMRAMVFGPEVG